MTPERGSRLAAHIGLLERRFPKLARRLAAVQSASGCVQPARNGSMTLFADVGGKRLALHSPYDPEREADEFLAGQFRGPADAYALLGLGLGYHAQALVRSLTPSALLLLFEPSCEVLRAALEHRDLAELLQKPNIWWFADEPDGELLETLLPLAERLAEGLHVLVPPATVRRAPQYTERVRRLVADVVSYGEMARTTKVAQSRRALTNLLGNLERYAAAESLVPWQNRWRGYPAVVVSAGPSLARNRSLLPMAKGKALIVAVGTALKPLLAVGIEPDLVVHIDHSDLCSRHFEGVADPGRTVLLAEATASPVVLGKWPGRLALLRHPFAEFLLGSLARPMPQLRPGMTVAHTAFYAAQFCGADPILFTGQDLAFTEGLYYSPGNGLHELWYGELNRFCTVETKEWERLVRRKAQLVMVPGCDGRPVLADRQMLHYLRQFERDFAHAPTTVIDATEGGARKAGAHVMTLRHALDRFLKGKFPAGWTNPDEASGRPDAAAIRRQMSNSAQRLADFRYAAQKIADLQRQILAGPAEAAAGLLPELGTWQQIVQHQHRNAFQMAAAFDGALELEKERQTRQIDAARLAPPEHLRRSLERDLAYVEGLAAAAERLIGLAHDVARDSAAQATARDTS